jgi:hypothetical protein
MTHDRVPGDQFELTHHILSQMLGVRRASVTEAALALSEAGAIDYHRGLVTVLDRAALHRAACECYGMIRSTFDRLLGGGETPSPLDGIRLSEGGRSIAKDARPRQRLGRSRMLRHEYASVQPGLVSCCDASRRGVLRPVRLSTRAVADHVLVHQA